MLMLMLRLSSLAHKLLMVMFMLHACVASKVETNMENNFPQRAGNDGLMDAQWTEHAQYLQKANRSSSQRVTCILEF